MYVYINVYTVYICMYEIGLSQEPILPVPIQYQHAKNISIPPFSGTVRTEYSTFPSASRVDSWQN